jgi:hypothetical protein
VWVTTASANGVYILDLWDVYALLSTLTVAATMNARLRGTFLTSAGFLFASIGFTLVRVAVSYQALCLPSSKPRDSLRAFCRHSFVFFYPAIRPAVRMSGSQPVSARSVERPRQSKNVDTLLRLRLPPPILAYPAWEATLRPPRSLATTRPKLMCIPNAGYWNCSPEVLTAAWHRSTPRARISGIP